MTEGEIRLPRHPEEPRRDETRGRPPSLHPVAITHAIFDVASGLWPIVHLRSFEAVTGRKREGWLVKTTGALIAVVGATIGLAAVRRRVTPEIKALAVGSAAALGLVDVIFATRRRISPVYLADSVLELGLVVSWLAAKDH